MVWEVAVSHGFFWWKVTAGICEAAFIGGVDYAARAAGRCPDQTDGRCAGTQARRAAARSCPPAYLGDLPDAGRRQGRSCEGRGPQDPGSRRADPDSDLYARR